MKYPAFIGLKLPDDLFQAAKRQAEADDRTLSAYLRRIIAGAVRTAQAEAGDKDSHA